jgi:hypothetical protein
MKSQEYDDIPYYVNKVPWVMFFQAHNALHGAYWHDRFGITKSHGCVNLSPKDAHAIFDWLEPALPAGWTSVRYYNLNQAPVVHVHNSSKKRSFYQERNIGPPDKNDEAERVTQAVARREAKEREAALLAAGANGTLPAGMAMPPSAANATPVPIVAPSGAGSSVSPGLPPPAAGGAIPVRSPGQSSGPTGSATQSRPLTNAVTAH